MSITLLTIRRADCCLPRSSKWRGLGTAVLVLALYLPGLATAQSLAVGRPTTAEVRMYVLPNCGYCDRARNHLQARQIRFDELDIAADAQAKAAFDTLGGAGTPLIVIGDRVIHGFDPARIDAALAGVGN